jgi:hypothetical protein
VFVGVVCVFRHTYTRIHEHGGGDLEAKGKRERQRERERARERERERENEVTKRGTQRETQRDSNLQQMQQIFQI